MRRKRTISPPHLTEYKRVDSDHAWRVSAANGQILAGSGEGYRRKIDMRRAVWSVLEALLRWAMDRDAARLDGLYVKLAEAYEGEKVERGEEA